MPLTLDELMTRRPTTEFAAELSQKNLDEFRERGFTSIARITTDEELEWLGQVYDLLFEERVQPVPGGYIDLIRPYDSKGGDLQPQIIVPETRYAELRRTQFWRNGRQLASKLLGVEAKDLRGWGHMIRKPPRVGDSLPWHQDEAYWDPGFEYVALGCWMPLDPATVESGCMSFIPGSHRGDVRTHRHLGDDPAVHALVIDDVDASSAVPMPVAVGGAVFHHCRILHRSGPNRSARVRRAYSNEWQLPPVKRETAMPARPWIDEGKRAWEERDLKS
jgi:phytanoyl-CoA dioxygenase PhyH